MDITMSPSICFDNSCVFDGLMFAFRPAMRYWLPAMFVLLAGIAHAGPAEQGTSPPTQAPRRSPDFLFGRPDGSVGIRGSWIFSRAGSDWYDFVTDQLTIDHGAFNAPAVTFEVGFLVTPRFDVLAGVDISNTSTSSEYRRYVDNNRLPITQQTELRGTTISGSVKYALVPRGREVGSIAWVPSSIVPYVGAGGGAHWYRVTQQGDFVDYVDLSVFSDVFRSSGWSPSAHVFGGADIKLYKRLYLTVEARYEWAAGDLGADWIGFDPIDLSGLHVGTGINVVF
jgi:hypothetical protein